MKNLYTLADLEAAINYWRDRSPSTGEALTLCPEAAALAEPYALLIFRAQREIAKGQLSHQALAALASWQEATTGEHSYAPGASKR